MITVFEMLEMILGILGVFAWCFLCLGLFGFVVYLNERRIERKHRKGKAEIIHVEKGNGWVRYYTNEGWSKE